jgi:hypothetical protein
MREGHHLDGAASDAVIKETMNAAKVDTTNTLGFGIRGDGPNYWLGTQQRERFLQFVMNCPWR